MAGNGNMPLYARLRTVQVALLPLSAASGRRFRSRPYRQSVAEEAEGARRQARTLRGVQQLARRRGKKSALLAGQSITSIPNPIDTHVFCPADKAAARLELGLPEDRNIILFVSQRVTDKRKGMDYLVEAVRTLTEKHPEMKADTAIAILGGHSEELAGRLDLPVYPLGYISEEHKIAGAYNAADVFVSPSLEDNLPNTIMEAMACGVPCAGFKVGGIPEMIDNGKNGYVAALRDADDLARGIHWACALPIARHCPTQPCTRFRSAIRSTAWP